jgi:hypothetical protein
VHDNLKELQFAFDFGTMQNRTQNGIDYIYGDDGVRLRINYTGVVSITGAESRSGKFFVSLKKNQTDIEIDIV